MASRRRFLKGLAVAPAALPVAKAFLDEGEPEPECGWNSYPTVVDERGLPYVNDNWHSVDNGNGMFTFTRDDGYTYTFEP